MTNVRANLAIYSRAQSYVAPCTNCKIIKWCTANPRYTTTGSEKLHDGPEMPSYHNITRSSPGHEIQQKHPKHTGTEIRLNPT